MSAEPTGLKPTHTCFRVPRRADARCGAELRLLLAHSLPKTSDPEAIEKFLELWRRKVKAVGAYSQDAEPGNGALRGTDRGPLRRAETQADRDIPDMAEKQAGFGEVLIWLLLSIVTFGIYPSW